MRLLESFADELAKHAHVLTPEVGEVMKLNGIPFRYVGNGRFVGGTDPMHARSFSKQAVSSEWVANKVHSGLSKLLPYRREEVAKGLAGRMSRLMRESKSPHIMERAHVANRTAKAALMPGGGRMAITGELPSPEQLEHQHQAASRYRHWMERQDGFLRDAHWSNVERESAEDILNDLNQDKRAYMEGSGPAGGMGTTTPTSVCEPVLDGAGRPKHGNPIRVMVNPETGSMRRPTREEKGHSKTAEAASNDYRPPKLDELEKMQFGRAPGQTAAAPPLIAKMHVPKPPKNPPPASTPPATPAGAVETASAGNPGLTRPSALTASFGAGEGIRAGRVPSAGGLRSLFRSMLSYHLGRPQVK